MTFSRKSASIFIALSVFLLVGVAYASDNMSNDKSLIKNQVKKSTENSAPSTSVPLTKVYDNHDSKYLIKYPSDWIYDESEKGAVVFSGKKNTPAYYTTINIQTVLTKKAGGDYSSVADLISDIKRQVLAESPKTNFVDRGKFEIPMKNGSNLTGQSLSFIYTYKGHIIQQWQVVVLREDKLVLYTWAYTAPIEQYNDNLSTAKTMLSSWMIY